MQPISIFVLPSFIALLRYSNVCDLLSKNEESHATAKGHFTRGDEELIASLAVQLASTLEKTLNYEKSRKAMDESNETLASAKSQMQMLQNKLEHEEQKVKGMRRSSAVDKRLLAMTKRVASKFELDQLFESVMNDACTLLNADRATLFLLNDSKSELYSKIAKGADPITIPSDKGICGHVASTGEVLNIRDAYSDSRFNPEVDKKSGYRTKTVLCAPVCDNDSKVVGVIQIINKKSEGPFSEGDINLLKAFSSHVFVAVQNCNARVSSTKELEESMSSLHTLRDQLSEIVNTKGTLQKTYEHVPLHQKHYPPQLQHVLLQATAHTKPHYSEVHSMYSRRSGYQKKHRTHHQYLEY